MCDAEKDWHERTFRAWGAKNKKKKKKKLGKRVAQKILKKKKKKERDPGNEVEK